MFLQSDNPLDTNKSHYIDDNSNHEKDFGRESISSPGFDDNTSNSTLSAASPDPAYSSYNSNDSRHRNASVQSWAEKHHSSPSSNQLKPKPRLTAKIEGHLTNYETKLNNGQDERNANTEKMHLPKIDISLRRELFEKEQKSQFNRTHETKKPINLTEITETPVSIKERLSHLEKRNDETKDVAVKNKLNRLSGDFNGVRDRFANGEIENQFVNVEPKSPKIDVPLVPLKECLLTLESSMITEISPANNQFEQRMKKMNDPKSIGGQDEESSDEIFDVKIVNKDINQQKQQQQNEEKLKEDEDSGINSVDLQSSLASQQSQLQPINNNEFANKINEQTIKSNEPIPVARKPEVLPRRQITPDLVKITSNLNIEDDLLQSQDEIDDEADNSVSLTNANTIAIAKNLVNLTIKSVLVDSIDMNKVSSPISTSISCNTLVMENKSTETAVISDHTASKHNENDQIVDNNNIDSSVTVNVDQILTDIPNEIELNNGKNENISAQKTINQTITMHSAEQSIQMSENKSTKVHGIDDEHKQIQTKHESIENKNERIKCQIVGVLEKHKISALPLPNNNFNELKLNASAFDPSLSPSKTSNKSPCKSPSKSKNIFDFIKRNLLNESMPAADQNQRDDENFKFYVSLNESKQLTSSTKSNETYEIDRSLDEEIDKLSGKSN